DAGQGPVRCRVLGCTPGHIRRKGKVGAGGDPRDSSADPPAHSGRWQLTIVKPEEETTMSTEQWEIASSSRINFTVRHLLISKARGRFTRWSGNVLVPDGDWGRATVDVTIDASSIDTGIPKRDVDLRSANFLDV